jgi:hypothetical protein
MTYLLDANAFIEAQKRWYGFDFCPAYWDWLEQSHAAGLVFSVEKVRDELLAGDDDLVPWGQAHGDDFFLKPDSAVLTSLSQLSTWATSGEYDASAASTFLDIADSYLVAHAHGHGHTVVTHERIANSAKKAKIPNACVALGVRYLTTFEMLRIERARFVLP